MRTLFRRPQRPRGRTSTASVPPRPRLDHHQISRKQEAFAKRRTFSVDDYATLLAPYRNHEDLRLVDYVRETEIGDRRILLIRHDVDHDHLTAIRIAEWEASHGLRATYCLLHTAWYYGELVDGQYVHTEDVVECAQRLVELGHEVNFHNNLVATALRCPDIDPEQVLAGELAFFRNAGVPVAGTSSHGDALCRDLAFVNWELFADCMHDRFGRPRTALNRVDGELAHVELGRVQMADHGLEYEAYDIVRDVYHTESGSRARTRYNTFGRRPFGRTDPSRGQVVGVLTHPIWWDFPAT